MVALVGSPVVKLELGGRGTAMPTREGWARRRVRCARCGQYHPFNEGVAIGSGHLISFYGWLCLTPQERQSHGGTTIEPEEK